MITMLKGLKVTKALLNLRGPGEGGFKILSKSTLELFLIDGSNIYQMLLVPLKNIVPSRNYCRSKVSTYV